MRIKKSILFLFIAMMMTMYACEKTEQITPNKATTEQEANGKLSPLMPAGASAPAGAGFDLTESGITSGGILGTGGTDPLTPVSSLIFDEESFPIPNMCLLSPEIPLMVSPFRLNNAIYLFVNDNPNDEMPIESFDFIVWEDNVELQSGQLELENYINFSCEFEKTYDIDIIATFVGGTTAPVSFCFETDEDFEGISPIGSTSTSSNTATGYTNGSTGILSELPLENSMIFLELHYNFNETTSYCKNTGTIPSYDLFCDGEPGGGSFTFVIPD